MSKYNEEDEVDYSDSSLVEESSATSDTAQGAEDEVAQEHIPDEQHQPYMSEEDGATGSSFSDSSEDEDEVEDGEDDDEQDAEEEQEGEETGEEDYAKHANFFNEFDSQSNLAWNQDQQQDQHDHQAPAQQERRPLYGIYEDPEEPRFSPETWERLQEEAHRGFHYHDRPVARYQGLPDADNPNGVGEVATRWWTGRRPPMYPAPQLPRVLMKKMGDKLPVFPHLPMCPSLIGASPQADSEKKQKLVHVARTRSQGFEVRPLNVTHAPESPLQPHDDGHEDDHGPGNDDGSGDDGIEEDETSSHLPLERPSNVPGIREDDPATPGSPITDESDGCGQSAGSESRRPSIPWEKLKAAGKKIDWADEDDEEDWIGTLSVPTVPRESGEDLVGESKASNEDMFDDEDSQLTAASTPATTPALETCRECVLYQPPIATPTDEESEPMSENSKSQEETVMPLDNPYSTDEELCPDDEISDLPEEFPAKVLIPDRSLEPVHGSKTEGTLETLRRNKQPHSDIDRPQRQLKKSRLGLLPELEDKIRNLKRKFQALEGRFQAGEAEFNDTRKECDWFQELCQRLDAERRDLGQQLGDDRKYVEETNVKTAALIKGLYEQLDGMKTKLKKAEETSKRMKKWAEDLEPLADAERTRLEKGSTDAATQFEPKDTEAHTAKCGPVKCPNCQALMDQNATLKDERDSIAVQNERLRGEMSSLQASLQVKSKVREQARRLDNTTPVLHNVSHEFPSSDSLRPSPVMSATPDLPSDTPSSESKPAWQVRMESWRKTPEFRAKCEALESQAKAQKLARERERAQALKDRELRLNVYKLITGETYEYMPPAERSQMLLEMQSCLRGEKRANASSVRV
ncbi:unnamed protein product [Zymoseptoria tritici ST99CH_3D7]|uniref:Uncharacterized protein n=1 Tax=Zymoseptoria tritici (strain ST99CH_3D7) TaxID=1276538 RepID=A0A1X7S3P6_ZYMT9|nr:unnamed protein product [Zymoseptoria tritici ST99CH_3D7]